MTRTVTTVATVDWPGVRASLDVPDRLLDRLQRIRCAPPAWAGAVFGRAEAVHIAWSGAGVITRNGEPVAHVSRASEALPLIQRVLMSAAVSALAPRFVLLHAAAIACGDAAMLLPASSGSGKSTLVAGLVAAGCAYLSDEVAMLDPSSETLLPFGNALSLKAGGRQAFREAYPGFAHADVPRERIDSQALWRVPSQSLRQPSEPVKVRFVVLPRYVAGRRSTLSPIARKRALEACLTQIYRLELHGPAGVAALVNTIQGSHCFSLVGGDLKHSIELLLELLRNAASGGLAAPADTGAAVALAAG